MENTQNSHLKIDAKKMLANDDLRQCELSTQGLYFRLILFISTQPIKGILILKEKFRGVDPDPLINFSKMLSVFFSLDQGDIYRSLSELLLRDLIILHENEIHEPISLKNKDISIIRSIAGKIGGKKNKSNKPGYVYLMSDRSFIHKIGVSVNPLNRCYRFRSDLKMKKFEIIDTYYVSDMVAAEDICCNYFSEFIENDWIKTDHNTVNTLFRLLRQTLEKNHILLKKDNW